MILQLLWAMLLGYFVMIAVLVGMSLLTEVLELLIAGAVVFAMYFIVHAVLGHF